MPSARKKCICQLCTCGRHMCPHRKKEQLVLGNDQQSAKSLTREEKRKHRKQWEIPNDKQDVSLSNDQLGAQSVLTKSKSNSTAVIVEDTGTTVRNESKWSSRQIPKTLPIKRPDNLKQEGDADFKTTHQQDFASKKKDSTTVSFAQSSSELTRAESWNKRQIPKTQKIRQPDTLTFSGSTNYETTHKSEYREKALEEKNAMEEAGQHEIFQRPRTSLKMSGEFQTDSSYQTSFTPKRADDNFKVKKGTSKSNLKPEGEMTFDTTSLDYNAVSTHVSRATENNEEVTVLKPRKARPQSEIKIPSVPISDETTLVSDFKRWNVDKPTRHKPSDTLQLGDNEETSGSQVNGKFSSRSETSYTETSTSDYKNWQVKRPIIQKPENNLKPEGDFHFSTTNDDYSVRRDNASKRTFTLEPLTERTETESIPPSIQDEPRSVRVNEVEIDSKARVETDALEIDSKSKAETRDEAAQQDTGVQAEVANNTTEGNNSLQTTHQIDNTEYYNNENASSVEEQTQYVSWDQIRPKPIRPHSNLRQEGEMQFNTTNRSEFVTRSTERVKGIRPKTSTKLFDGEFDATTMNQVMFSSEQGEKVSPIRPKSNLHVENADFVDETTSAREFQPWQVSKPSPIVPKSNLTQEGSMDFTTTNNTEFEGKRPEKVFPIRPTTTNRISGDIDLTTTNRVMHSEFPIERVKKIVPQSTLRINSGTFDDETTNKSQFQEWGIDRPKPIRPVPNLTQEGSMDFTTMNQMQFEEKPLEKLTQFRPHTSSKITGDFDGVTTNQIMFGGQSSERQAMIKPKGNIQMETGKFATDTTNHSEFQKWEHSKPDAVTPRNNLHQEGALDFTTTSQVQFGAKAIDRVSEIRPQTNSKITGDFDGTTTNQVMFQNSPREKLKPIRPQHNIQLEKGNFEGESTTNREFQQWEYSKPSLIKPHSSMRQEGNMDFSATNEREFPRKKINKVSQIRPTNNTEITGEFDSTTMNQIMFQPNSIERVKGKRPATNIHLETGKFESKTTTRQEFQQWDIDRPVPIKPTGNLTQEGQMDFTTSNQTDFETKTLTKVEPIRPQATSPITGEFDGTTTNKIMFKTQTIERVHNIRPKDNLRVDSGQFNGETTSSKEFGYKKGMKPEAIKPKPNLAQEGDFDFTTSNQMQFEGKQTDKVNQIRPKTLTKAADGKFYSTTTNQAMYQTPAMEISHEIRPTDNLHVGEGKFNGKTTSSDEYQQWQVQKPKAFQLVSSLQHEGDMQFETTNNAEFKQRGFDKVQQIRPKTTNKIEGDLDTTTTNQVMFQQHERLERVKPIRHENNLHVEGGKFSNETTTNREFRQWVKIENKETQAKKKSRAAGVRTQKGVSKSDSEDQKTATNKEEKAYEPWKTNSISKDDYTIESLKSTGKADTFIIDDTSKSDRPSKTENQNHSFGEISGAAQTNVSRSSPIQQNDEKRHRNRDISTVMADYGGKQTTKVKAIIPNGNLSTDGNMNFSTTSKTDYVRQTDSSRTQESKQEKIAEKSHSNVKHDAGRSSQQIASGGISKSEVGKGEVIISQTERRAAGTKSLSPKESSPTSSPEKVVRVTKRYKPDDNLKIEQVPFDANSTSRAEYKKWETRRSSSKKRTESLKQEGNMEFDTTSNDYSLTKTYQMSRENTKAKSKADQRGSLGQSGSMDFHTTSNLSYTGNYGSKSKNMRPRSSLKLGAEEHTSEAMSSSRSDPETTSRSNVQDLTSTSRASYVSHTSRRAIANRPVTSQKIGQGTFEGQSTSRTSFTAPQSHAEKSRPIKPENHNILNVVNGFSGNTTYRNSFDAAKGHNCPVIDLQAGRSSLTFNEEKNGHIFYAPPVQG